jgi:hypothetical protein
MDLTEQQSMNNSSHRYILVLVPRVFQVKEEVQT